MTEPNLHALTGAYVLDALDDAERAAFEAHLTGCPECTAEVASLAEAVGRMAAGDATTPPPSLAAAVREQIATTQQVAPAGSTTPPPVTAAPHAPGAPSRRRVRPHAWRLGAVAAVLVGALAIGGSMLASARHAAEESAAVQAQVVQIMAAPDMVSRDLGLGTHLVVSESMGEAAVMGSDVPMPTGSGMVYQVWMQHTDGSLAAGPTFMPEHGAVTAVLRADFSEVAALMLTEEPAGGSPAPTGEYLAELHL